MNLLAYDGYIKHLVRVYYTPGYEFDDFVQDIYLTALVTPYRGEANPNIERAYLKIIAKSRRRAFFRRKYSIKGQLVVVGNDGDYADWLAQFAGSGGQFEHVLLRETLEELRAPAPFKGHGNSGRQQAAKNMIKVGFCSVLARITARERYNVFCLRRKLRPDHSLLD